MTCTWLGQSGYLLESAGFRLLVDPFLSDLTPLRPELKRLVDPPLAPEALRPDAMFITHDHVDHFDPIALPELHRAFSRAKVIGPVSVMAHARRLGFDEAVLVELPKGARGQFGPFLLKTTPAYHSDPFAVGCVLEAGGHRAYVSGDTLRTETLVDDVRAVAGGPLDAVFIVINGKLGNMTLPEATEVVEALQPALAVPMHYGMFADNTADPHEFARTCRAVGIRTRIPALGKSFDL